jgi:3-dehydroquinate synthase
MVSVVVVWFMALPSQNPSYLRCALPMGTLDIHRIKTDGYTISAGRFALGDLAETLSSDAFAEAKVFILCDENTLRHCLPAAVSKIPSLQHAEVLEVEPGEGSKSIEVCTQLWQALSEMGADRHSVLVNLGGGVVSDLGGFVAGTYKRGIRYFNVPTSLVAQVDASIGAKVGIDLHHVKNAVGLFNHPNGVYVDPAFLETLPRRHVINGFAEMVKHALICSPGYWRELQDLSLFDRVALDAAILRSIALKNEIVCSDPFETGLRKMLNFGHSVGHALESVSLEGYTKELLHGEAVAAGMVCEAFISYKAHLLTERSLQEITEFIFSHFPRVEVDPVLYHRVIELMRQDKKNRAGKLRLSLLQGIGDCITDQEVPADVVVESLQNYRRWVG